MAHKLLSGGAVLWLAAGVVYARWGADSPAARHRTWADLQVVERVRDRPIEGLTPADFEILDDGRPVDITFFATGDVALDLVIVEPASDLLRLEGIGKIIDGAPAALRELRPGDRVAIVRASPKGELVFGLTADLQLARENLFRMDPRPKPRKSDCLSDAVSLAAKVLSGPAGPGLRRRAIVIVADDRESGSMETESAAATAALKAGATVNLLQLRTEVEPILLPVHSIGMPPWFLSAPVEWTLPGRNWRSIMPVVTATGGDSMTPDQRSGRLAELIRRLHARYLVGFSAPRSHGICVRVKGPRGTNAEVRASLIPESR